MARLASHIAILLVGVLLNGCTSTPMKMDSTKVYPHDMKLKVNGHKGTGMLIVPAAGVHNFEVEARGKLDLFAFSSCHRHQYQEEAWEEGWFSSEYKTKLEYTPSTKERGHCPVLFEGYEKKRGRHSTAFVDFEDGSANLPALIFCNGSTYNSRGTTACQSRAGLKQHISFADEVNVVPPPGCAVPETKDNKEFRYPISSGECVYIFRERSGDVATRKHHRLTTWGYDEVPLRED